MDCRPASDETKNRDIRMYIASHFRYQHNWNQSKKNSIERIDGIVALIMGLDRATTQPPPYQWSEPEVVGA